MKEELSSAIVNAIKEDEKCIIWSSTNEETILRANMDPKSLNIEKGQLSLKIEDPSSKYYFEEMLNGPGALNLYFTDSGLICTTMLIKYEDDNVKLGLTDKYRFINRRRQERIRPDEVQVNVYREKKKIISKVLHDFSVGGCSFVVMKGEPFSADEDEQLKIGFKVGDKEILIRSRLVRKLTLKPFLYKNCPYGGRRISFQFLETSDAYQALLEKLIEFYSKSGRQTVNS